MNIKKQFTEWKKSNPIKKFRSKNKLSQADMASLLGVAAYTLQRWEDGAMNPGEANVNKLNSTIDNFENEWKEWKKNKPTV